MKHLLIILLSLSLLSCKREKVIDDCSDKVIYIANWGELHTITVVSAHPVPEDWAIRCEVINEGRKEVHQVVIRKGTDRNKVEFQSNDKIEKFQLVYCGPMDN